MPVPNLRVVVVGTPKVDGDFDVLDLTRDRLQRLAKELERGCQKAKRDLDHLVRYNRNRR